MCLVAGLVEIQRLADSGTRAGVTSAYYALTYLAFGAPYLLAAAANVARYSVLLMAAAGLGAPHRRGRHAELETGRLLTS